MKAYVVICGFWDERVMFILADSEEEAREMVDCKAYLDIRELPTDKPGIIYTYDR